MKKRLILLFILAILPITALAKPYYANYKTKNLKETLEEEQIELANPDYKENDKQAIIYLFRGQGCGFCHRLLEYLNSITTEYGNKFKVVSFEVWYDDDNKNLFNKIATITGVPNNGVPYYIIGEKVFTGYAEDFNDGIKEAIDSEYKNHGEDVFEKLAKSERKNLLETSDIIVICSVLVIVAVGTFINCMVSSNNTRKVLAEIQKVQNKEVKVEKKEVKETVKAELKEKTKKTKKKA